MRTRWTVSKIQQIGGRRRPYAVKDALTSSNARFFGLSPRSHARYFILWTLQAVLFYLPTIVWHGLNSKAGVDADSILAAAHTFAGLDDVGGGERMLKLLVRQMDRFLSSRRPTRQQPCSCAECVKDGCQLCGRRQRRLLSFIVYILTIVVAGTLCPDIHRMKTLLRKD